MLPRWGAHRVCVDVEHLHVRALVLSRDGALEHLCAAIIPSVISDTSTLAEEAKQAGQASVAGGLGRRGRRTLRSCHAGEARPPPSKAMCEGDERGRRAPPERGGFGVMTGAQTVHLAE